ncbi:MAG: hypothetical protein HN526_05160 [Gammaproteobacteria bacterium]|nr:hypothetical protein [Gammaproteobacteria bacterium]
MNKSKNTSNTIRELSEGEMRSVKGGIVPFVAAASFATHHAVRTIGQYYLSRGLTSYAVYGVASAFSDK